MTLPQPEIYRGFGIEESEFLYKPCIIFFPTNGSWEGEVRTADDIEDAKDMIDDLLNLETV